MPTELLSVTEAAKDFLAKSGYSFVRLEKADLNDAKHEWVLTFERRSGGSKAQAGPDRRRHWQGYGL